MEPPIAGLPSELLTKRLRLRIPRVTDGPAVAAAVRASLPELKPWLPWATDAYDDREGELWCRRSLSRFILGEQLGYSIFDRATDELIGGVGPDAIDWKIEKCEIGYWIRSDRAGHGLMSEAVGAVVAYLDTTGLRRVEIRCDYRNVRSAAVARCCGFDHEGTLRYDSLDRDAVPRSTMIFGRINPTDERIGVSPASAPAEERVQSPG